MAGKVFVNYRRRDAMGDARGIYRALVQKFGERGVFMDVRDLSPGQEFDAVIASELNQSDVLVSVIGERWSDILAERTATSAQDLMRGEIATALVRNMVVIPVLIDEAILPASEHLPKDIQGLVAREKHRVRDKHFDSDVAVLIAAIEARRKERQSVGTTGAAQRRVALVIGNGRYQHAAPLVNPTKDANAIANMLATLGFDVVKGLDLDLKSMGDVQAIFESKLRSKPDVALVFFAGHGLQVKGRNYLLPIDAQIEAQAHLPRAVQFNHLLEPMAEVAGASLVFLDACRDNPFTRNLAKALGETPRGTGVVRGGLARMERVAGTFIAYATAPDKVAFDGKGNHSPFTAALLKYIRTPGLSVADLMIEVRNEVIHETGGQQEPWDQSSLRTRFCFVTAILGEEEPKRDVITVSPEKSSTPFVSRAKLSLVVATLTAILVSIAAVTLTESKVITIVDVPSMVTVVLASVVITVTAVQVWLTKKRP